MELFKLLGTIAIDNSGANKALKETSAAAKGAGNALGETSSSGEKSGGKLSAAFSKVGTAAGKVGSAALKVGKTVAVGMGVAATAVGGLVTKSVQSYADYEQLVGGVDTLFKKSSGMVQQYAKNAYKTAGMSANDYMETVTSFSASLLASLDNDTKAAAEKADMAITDMSDNANKMGSDMESIQNAYQGFAKQNYTMLDNLKLGYGGTKEEMQRLLKDAQAISGIEYDISSYADVVDAIHVIQTEMGITGTTAKEASTTISGSISSMKGAWQNLLTAISADDLPFDDYVDSFVDSVATVAENLMPRISIALEGVVQLVDKLAPIIIGKVPELFTALLPAVISAATGLINSLVSAFPDIISALVGVLPALISGMQSIVSSLVLALPSITQELILAIPLIVTEIGKALLQTAPVLLDTAKQIGSQIIGALKSSVKGYDGTFSGVVESFSKVKKVFSDVIKNSIIPLAKDFIKMMKELWSENKDKLNKIAQLFSLAFEKIGSVFKWLVGIVRNHMGDIKKTFQSGIDFISNIVDFFIALFKGDWQGMWDAVKRILKSGFAFVKNTFNLINSVIKSITSSIKKVVSDAFSKVKDAITKKLGEAKNKVKEIFTTVKNNIVNTLKGAISSVKSVGSDIVKGLWNGINDKVGWVVGKVKGFGSSILSGIKDFFGIKSPSRVMRDQVGAQLAAGVADGIKNNTKLAKASAEEMSQAVLDAAEKKLYKYKTYNDMTLAEEVRFWNDIRKECEKGTDARLEADKNYLEAKKSLNEQLIQAENEYKENEKEINKQLREDIKSLNKEYKYAVKERKSEILSAFSLFDDFGSSEAVDGSSLIEGLQTQVDALKDWKSNISALKNRMGDTNIFKEIQEMGVSALEQVKALNGMTDKELKTYTELYNKRQKTASKQAKAELKDLKEETIKQVDKLNESAEKQLEKNKKTWIETCDSLGVTVSDSSKRMSEKVTKNMTKIANSATTTMNKAVSAVEKGVKKMKNAMNFEWSLPNLKLPHFSVSGIFSINPPSVPKFDVQWYKKAMNNAMILENPTIFGYNAESGQYLGGGEAGSEVVAGSNTLMNMIQTAVSEQNETLVYYMQKLIDILASYFPQILESMDRDVVLDSGVLVGEISVPMNEALGKISNRKGRGR